MRLYQAASTAITLTVILSACGNGSAVSESDQVANIPEQETVVSNGSGSSSQETEVVVAPPATVATAPITTPISTPTRPTRPATSTTTTTATTTTNPTPVASAPVATPEPDSTPETAPAEPEAVFGAATLTSASVSGDNIVLSWSQTNDNPSSGYDILIDGAVASDLGPVTGTSATVSGLDLSQQHCFQVEALYTQVDPAESYTSNRLCSDAQQAPNQAPVISGSPSTNVDVGGSYSFTPTASDSDNDQLTFSVVNLPAWAQFNGQTGSLSGSPTADDAGAYNNIVISVSDGTDETSLTAFTITVNPDTTIANAGSISLRWVAPTSRTDGSTLSLSDIQGYCIYLGTTRDNLKMIADINQGDTTNYVVDNLDLGDYYVAVSVYDQNNNMSSYSNIVMKAAMN